MGRNQAGEITERFNLSNVTAIFGVSVYESLPEQRPIHFDINNELIILG